MRTGGVFFAGVLTGIVLLVVLWKTHILREINASSVPAPAPAQQSVAPPVVPGSVTEAPPAMPNDVTKAPAPMPGNVTGAPAPAPGNETVPAPGPGKQTAAPASPSGLLMPVEGVAPGALHDNFREARSGHLHEAIDIAAPRGTPVHAVAEGNVVKLFLSKPGGLTVYQFDDSQTFCYYYAHLDHYAKGLNEGMLLRKGDVLGYVGSTGDAPPNVPHLHFAIFKLGPEKRWWQGTAVDPYPLLAGPSRPKP